MSIEKINQEDQLSQSADLVNDNIDKLKALFPEIVTEGKINFNLLKLVLGEEIDEENENYSFTWFNKKLSIRESSKPSTGTLRLNKGEGVSETKTENLYIEGDNLEILKLLQKSYSRKIRVIYADPPYNTGKDILYKNDFSDNLNSYLRLTKQVGHKGDVLFTNTESSGRIHSEWLSMMYSRIRLSRNLLSDNGFFVIAIDHNELQNLIKICDEVFGEDNRLGIVTIVHKPEGRNQEKFFATSNEFCLFYSKNKSKCDFTPTIFDKKLEKTFDKEDDKGKYKLKDFIRLGGGDPNLKINKPHFYYPIYVSKDLAKLSTKEFKNSTPVYPDTKTQQRTWKTKIETTQSTIDEGELVAVFEGDKIKIFQKYRVDKGQLIKTHWVDKRYNFISRGTRVLEDIMEVKTFDFPKSLDLLIDIFKITTIENSIVMDLFSGSSTSAHAILNINNELNRKLKFIQLQLPEPTDIKSDAYKNGYKKITEIGKERIRRVVKKIKEEHPEKSKEMDLGFKVFKLDSSNIKSWDGNPENLNESLFDAVGNIKTDRTEEDVLYEILLKYGLDLTLPIEEKTIEGKKVFNVGLGSLFICLADGITSKVAEGIGQWKEACDPEICRVIFKDNGFTDVEKTNSVQTLKRYGINEIRSI